jgi:hypothetical protein
MRPRFYKLLGKLTVPVGDDAMEWAQTWTEPNRLVRQTEISNVLISTVFLGIDHNHFAMIRGDMDAPPILFETMIFPTDDERWNGYQTRCSTWDQALNMHNSAVAHVRKVLRQLPVTT